MLFINCAPEHRVRLDPLPSRTDAFTVLVAGDAEPNGIVDIRGGASQVFALVDPSGRFSAPVALRPAAENVIRAGDSQAQTVTHVMPDVRTFALMQPHTTELEVASDVFVQDGVAAFSGRTTPGARVVVSGGRVEIMVSSDASGGFTAIVPLLREPSSLLDVIAIGVRGQRSPTRQVYVEQHEEDAAPPVTPRLDAQALYTRGSRVTISGSTQPGSRVRIIGETEGYAGEDGRFALGVSVSPGEHVLHVVGVAVDDVESAPVDITVTRKAVQYTSRYPIVLVHGMGGFDDIHGYKYFFGIEARLRELGFEAYTVSLTPVATPETRARELKAQLLAYTNGKVNIVAHSQGTIDARYMISRLDMADHVASYTSIAGPHHGSRVSDVALGLLPGPMEMAIDFLCKLLHWEWAAVAALTEESIERDFNPHTPDAPGVYYQSWSGAADPFGTLTDTPLSAWLVAPWLVLDAVDGDTNDGLVTLRSGQWGRWRGRMTADHFTEVGQVAGLVRGFDYEAFYEDLAIDLAEQGF